ncbi:YeiH family protein [Halocatena marina]|uniref:YeiH family protein n=1 Tax=Halocatena marina TaxID=2934937 RepID=UPI0020100498|nr:putative sulfate exporter family transporter [Halocatena marina]
MVNRSEPEQFVLPGLGVLAVIGLAARTVTAVVPVSHLIVAIFIGVIIGNIYGVPRWALAGVGTNKLLLEAGIVIMGANVALGRVIAAGPKILILVTATVVTTIVSVEVLARGTGIRNKVGSLLAAGSGICGVSAVVATAGSIEADEKQIAYAAATVLLFDALTLIIYPAIGHILGLSDTIFGIWAGLTMFSTGPVAAAGFAFSNTAGKWALLVKLTRNALIGVAAIGYALYYFHESKNATKQAAYGGWSRLWNSFPKFVLGFLAVMLVANAGILSPEHRSSLKHASDWLFLFAFSGLGLEIRFDELRSTGLKPVLVVLISLIGVSSLCLFVLMTIFDPTSLS